MKQLFFLIIIVFLSSTYGQNIKLNGRVIDSKTNMGINGVNISISNSTLGTSTDEDGHFSLVGIIKTSQKIVFSFLGYESTEMTVADFLSSNRIIALKESMIELNRTVVVEGLLNKEGETPASFSKISRKEIENDYSVQDVPEYLSYLPSTTFYSEGGNGIGYNYISIRGFDQRRISISVNGIPQNDPEDHNVYWLDLPDLLESTDLIQVQRGAGAGIIGYPSIGGSINIITSPFSDKPNFDFSATVGSYNTRKYSLKAASGLINNKYSVYAKFSKIISDGYRDNSWVDFNSYHLSIARYDDNLTSIVNLYGGPISDGLAYYGIPKSFIKDKKLRKTNFLSKNEIENFSQPHYELLNELKLGNNLTLNSALFLVIGEGFFDYDGSWSIYYDDYFRLKENGFTTDQLPTNALIRAQVENKQWGWLPKLTWKHKNGSLIAGAEYRNHRSIHWGAIKYAENIPDGVQQDYRYYWYKGSKDIINFFANENYQVSEKLNILAELQLAYHKYRLHEERFVGNDISIDDLYFNPRFGLNYKFNNKLSSFISYARVTREPRLKNYYDAAESSGGATPQFEQNSDGSYNFDNPLVKPETMNDIELGIRYSIDKFTLSANMFYMIFNDEIVKKGQLDRFGQPVTGNVDKTIHSGIEISGNYNISKYFDFIFNSSYSRNYISDGFAYINADNGLAAINLKDNSISGFPELTMNAILRGNYKGLQFQLSGKYVGDYFSDNYDNNLKTLLKQYPGLTGYDDNNVESYFVTNFLVAYNLKLVKTFNSVRIFAQVNNLFDELYASHASGGDFYPAAERNILVGIKLGM